MQGICACKAYVSLIYDLEFLIYIYFDIFTCFLIGFECLKYVVTKISVFLQKPCADLEEALFERLVQNGNIYVTLLN